MQIEVSPLLQWARITICQRNQPGSFQQKVSKEIYLTVEKEDPQTYGIIEKVKNMVAHFVRTSGGMSRVVYIVQGAGILCRRG